MYFVSEWRLTDEIKKTVDDAKARYAEATSKLDIAYFQTFKFGKKLIKKNKLSPDSFMQLALQVHTILLALVIMNVNNFVRIR